MYWCSTGNRRHVQPEQAPHLAGVVAGAQHDVLGRDVALGRAHAPLPAGGALQRGRLGVLVDLGADAARALAQRHGEIGRRNVTVVRVIERADDGRGVRAATEFGQRPQLLDTLGRDDLERHADGVGRAAVLLILVHALAAGRQAQVAGHVKAHVLAGLGRQPLVQIDRVLVQLADRVTHVEQRQEPRRVPGGACGELGALDQRHVGPALPRQVVERAHTHHAATDDQNPHVRLHSKFLPKGRQRCGGPGRLQCSERACRGVAPIATTACLK